MIFISRDVSSMQTILWNCLTVFWNLSKHVLLFLVITELVRRLYYSIEHLCSIHFMNVSIAWSLPFVRRFIAHISCKWSLIGNAYQIKIWKPNYIRSSFRQITSNILLPKICLRFREKICDFCHTFFFIIAGW